jgi:hypothetical protein
MFISVFLAPVSHCFSWSILLQCDLSCLKMAFAHNFLLFSVLYKLFLKQLYITFVIEWKYLEALLFIEILYDFS